MLFNYSTIHGPHAKQKDKQKAEIFSCIANSGPLSRRDITHTLKLRSTTVSNIVGELVADGLLREGLSKNLGRPGRPDLSLSPVFDRMSAISLFVEDRYLIGSLIDIGGRVLRQAQVYVPADGGNEICLEGVDSLIKTLFSEVPTGCELLGVGMSVVGTVNTGRGIWVNADRWPEIRNLDLGKYFQRKGLNFVLRRNLDIELEYMLEKHPGSRKENTILFHWGFGVGGAYAYQGRVLDSPFGRVMDIGHTIIHPHSDKKCRCGVYGCVESEAAIYALLPTLRHRYPDLREESEDIEKILSYPEVFEIPGIGAAVDTVGLCLSNLFKIFYPHRIFLVGAFIRNEKIVGRLEKILLETFYPKMKDTVHHVDLEVIRDGFTGCTWANGYPFFRKRLKELLSGNGN
jgi:transcriptional regulator of PTS gene